MKALIFAEGNGYGHASRDRIISDYFGIPIMTFGKGAEFARDHDMDLIEIPAPYAIQTRKNKTKIATSVLQLAKLLKPDVVRSVSGHFKDYDLIIVDGTPLGIALAMLAKKKALYITNDTASLVGITGDIQKRIAASLYRKMLVYPEKVIVPDFPPPLTVTIRNLNTSIPMDFCGPLIGKIGSKKHRKRFVVNKNLENELRPWLGEDAVYGSDVSELLPYMAGAEAVICHGGHTTIMEALSCGRPLICIEDKAHAERYNNASTLEKNGVGVMLERSLLSRDSLECAIDCARALDRKRLGLYKRNKPDPLPYFEKILRDG